MTLTESTAKPLMYIVDCPGPRPPLVTFGKYSTYSSKLETFISLRVSSVKAVTVTGILEALSSFLVAETTTSSICRSCDSAVCGIIAATAPRTPKETLFFKLLSCSFVLIKLNI